MLIEPKQFRGQKGEWKIFISLAQEFIEIIINSQRSLDVYQATITKEYIANDKNLEFFFKEPEEVYDFIIASFSQLSVSESGTILLNMNMPVGKLTKKVQFKIQTNRKEISTAQKNEIKMERLQKDIYELRQENRQLRQKIVHSEESITEVRSQINRFMKILQEKDEIINTIFYELKELSRWKEQKEKQVYDLLKENRKFIADEMNSHNTKFSQIGNKFRKTSGGNWDVLINKLEIEKNQIYLYHIRQIRAGPNGSFMYGIGTAAVKGISRAQDHREFIGYYENTGSIYDRGESRKGGVKVKDGDAITIEIDTRSWRIAWIIEGNRQAECVVQGDLRVKPIYLTLVVYNEDSEVEFI